jgi:hypothetical protein
LDGKEFIFNPIFKNVCVWFSMWQFSSHNLTVRERERERERWPFTAFASIEVGMVKKTPTVEAKGGYNS